MHYCYILYSNSLHKHYIGSSTEEPNERLRKHLNQHYGIRKYTAKSKDWEIYFVISCNTIEQARKIEKNIKRMKSSGYIESLKLYPDLVDKLFAKY